MRATTISRLLLLGLLASACDGGFPWGSGDDGSAGTGGDGLGPAAAYERHLMFLGNGPDVPAAAIFDFATRSDSDGLRRTARATVTLGGRWDTLLDESWSLAPVREPWRLFPRGPLRVIVTDAGELAALVHDGDATVRLETGALITEGSPDGSTQLVLRSARLTVAQASFAGVLLDAQEGYSPDEGAAGSAVPNIDAVLAHGSDFQVVLTSTGEDELAWIHDGGDTRIMRGIRLEADTTSSEPPANAGPAWRFAGDGLAGRVRREPPPGTTAESALAEWDGYILVSGWIEDAGVRLDVFGLVRGPR